MHFVTSTGQEIEVAARSRLAIQRISQQYNEAAGSLGVIVGMLLRRGLAVTYASLRGRPDSPKSIATV